MSQDDSTISQVPPDEDASRVDAGAATLAHLQPGDRVGHYVIREQIGEGGFAIVYSAEQEKPVRRMVALKVLNPRG